MKEEGYHDVKWKHFLSHWMIAEKCGVSQISVSKMIKLKSKNGSVSPRRRENSGRKSATTARNVAYLVKLNKI